jgi:quinol monooxygenase YgiN
VTPHQAFATITRGRFAGEHQTAGLQVLRQIVDLDADEPGTIIQAFHLADGDPNGFWAYELWESEEALDYHRNRHRRLRAQFELLVDGALEVHRCHPLLAKGLVFPPSGR